ncbi:RseA family anti-sigma factor [Roseateles sp. DC23W]|uniref:RseA family anti-sigma factor n=1 Tax=Pelomonas dachongensis TaxID=3299029 RepID=A0ABW7EQL4_9BURK
MVSAEQAALEHALSAVMDGSATPQQWAQVEEAWGREPALRERWMLWHTAGDGLRSADLAATRRHPADLLHALHAAMPAQAPSSACRNEWWSPLAVAAGFVALALGITQLQPAAPVELGPVAARTVRVPAQGLVGISFAQTAAGGALPGVGAGDVAWQPLPSLDAMDSSVPEMAAGNPTRHR